MMDLGCDAVGICATVGKAINSEVMRLDSDSFQQLSHHQSVGIIAVFFRAYEDDFSTKNHWEMH